MNFPRLFGSAPGASVGQAFSVDTGRIVATFQRMLKPPIQASELRHGDKIWTRGRTIGVERHYGVWDAEVGLVLHNTLPGGVRYVAFADFSNGGVWVESRALTGYEYLVIASARALIGRPYDLLAFNCEHYANLVHGKKESPQVQRAIGFLAVVGGIWGLLASANRPEHNAGSGRYHDRRTGRFVSR